MTLWFAAAIALLIMLAISGVQVVRTREIAVAAVAVQLAGALAAPLLVVVAVAIHRPSFIDLGLATAVTSVPAALMFAHFVQRSGK